MILEYFTCILYFISDEYLCLDGMIDVFLHSGDVQLCEHQHVHFVRHGEQLEFDEIRAAIRRDSCHLWTRSDLNLSEPIWTCKNDKVIQQRHFFCVLNFTTIYTREVTWLYLYFVNMCPICNSDMKRLGGFASFRSPAFPRQRSVFSR